MGWFVDFLNSWQNLFGALIGAFIAIFGSISLNYYLTTKNERKRQYSNLLLVLHDIQLFIARCETYLTFRNKSIVSFNNVVINDRLNYLQSSQVFNLNPEVYNSIQKIYNVAQVVKYNLENSEALTTEVNKQNKKEIHTQENVISGRYFRAIAFVEHWLEDVYRKFNFITKEIKNLSNEYNYLSFPDTIEGYTKDYVEKKIKEFNLKLAEIDGH